jgi:PKD repeat protein
MTHRAAPVLLSILAVFCVVSVITVVSCDKATPVAPSGSILVISANPTKIALNGTSTITVIGRKPDGQPLNPGTEIRLSATNGSIPAIVLTDRDGNATATYKSNGTPGNATITAATGTGSGSGGTTTSDGGTGTSSGSLTASVTIQVGVSAKSIIVQPTPTVIKATGGNVQLLAIVRDANGQPQPNQGVNFGTDLGQLDSRGATITTNALGQVHDTLRVTESDLANNATSIHITAQTAGSDGGLITGTATVQVQSNRPVAAFDFAKGSTDLEVAFTNRTTGTGSFVYSWVFGDQTSSNETNPHHLYASSGDYNVQLTVTDPSSGLSDTASARITVPVTQPGSGS